MKPKTNLYFIAIIPPNDLINHIEIGKLALANKYNCKEALKLMPYLSLQIPFRQLPFREEVVISKLRRFAHKQHPIMVKINGYGSFPEHSVFLNVKNSGPIKLLQQNLTTYLKTELNFSDQMVGYNAYKPHITMATKDIRTKFRKIWNDYKSKKFDANFQANSMYLLKHNYVNWEIIEELQFKGIGYTMDLFGSQQFFQPRNMVLSEIPG